MDAFPRLRSGVALLGAPSSIGIRPYDSGGVRELHRAPGVLRDLGLVERLRPDDFGDVLPPPYVDFERAPNSVRNEAALETYSRALADRVEAAVGTGRFTIVLGGDCSVILGCLLGARRSAGPLGLVYIDAHADFGTPEESITGSAASMCLAMAVGRGPSPLARLEGQPLVGAGHVALIGRRDLTQPNYGHGSLPVYGIVDFPSAAVAATGAEATARHVIRCLADAGAMRFWIHLDADVLDPEVMPAVDSPEPGGPGGEQLGALLWPLAHSPGAIGLDLTIYDPHFDTDDLVCGKRIVDLLIDSVGS